MMLKPRNNVFSGSIWMMGIDFEPVVNTSNESIINRMLYYLAQKSPQFVMRYTGVNFVHKYTGG